MNPCLLACFFYFGVSTDVGKRECRGKAFIFLRVKESRFVLAGKQPPAAAATAEKA